MALDGSEKVFCLDKAWVESHADWHGWQPIPSEDWLKTLLSRFQILPRTEALEQDQSKLQLISYGLVGTRLISQPVILVYRRQKAGTEHRLHGLRSLGVGGHVELRDSNPHNPNPRVAAARALDREVREELGLPGTVAVYLTPVGMIYDSTWQGVDGVHLGVVWDIPIAGRLWNCRPEPSIAIEGWMTVKTIVAAAFPWEKWSQVVVDEYLAPQLPKPAE